MSTSSRVAKSSLFLLSIQVLQRGLGIISTLILARLLTPEHFGIVALVTIALQFFELLVETGNRQYIVQKEHVDCDDLNTAWSMDVLIKSAMAILVILVAPSTALYFDTPELSLALSIAALAMPMRALKNPGMMRLAREINYRPLFRLTIWQKTISFLVVVTFAIIQPSHWAVIIGNLVSAIILATGSYLVDSHRPRWTLVHFRKQFGFSQWLLMRGVVGFTRSQVDNLMVSKLFGTTQLGGYNLVREISLLPAISAIIPMSEPLLAAIAESKNDPRILAYRVRLSLALMITTLIPITTFIMLYPEMIVSVLLGENWIDYALLLEPFGLFFFTFCLFSLISDAIIAQGKVKALFIFDLISTLVIFALLVIFGSAGLEAMAWSRAWLAVGTTAFLLWLLHRWIPFGMLRLTWLCAPVMVAVLCSALATTQLPIDEWRLLNEFIGRGTFFIVTSIASTFFAGKIFLGRSPEWQQLTSMANQLYIRLAGKR